MHRCSDTKPLLSQQACQLRGGAEYRLGKSAMTEGALMQRSDAMMLEYQDGGLMSLPSWFDMTSHESRDGLDGKTKVWRVFGCPQFETISMQTGTRCTRTPGKPSTPPKRKEGEPRTEHASTLLAG